MVIRGRERNVLIGGACLLGALLIFHLILYPALRRSRELDRLIPQKQRDLVELRLLEKELHSLRAMRTALVRQGPESERNLSPLSRMDRWIERAALRQNIRSIKPSPPTGTEAMTVEVQMERTDLPHLIRFLYEVQSSPGGSRIARMTIKPRYTTPQDLDVSLQMIFYQGEG